MSITLTKISAWSIPGCVGMAEFKTETLDECISRVMDIHDFNIPTRKREFIYAKHLKRFILERLGKDGQLTGEPRPVGGYTIERNFYYLLSQISAHCNCNHATILHSVKTVRSLIETDKHYRSLAEKVIRKIETRLIIFPEL